MMIHMISRTWKNKLKNVGRVRVITKECSLEAQNRTYVYM